MTSSASVVYSSAV